MEYTWENIVAFKVYKCKLCGATGDSDSMSSHLHKEHGLQSLSLFNNSIWSPNFEYPNVITKEQDIIEDGFGTIAPAVCSECGCRSMYVNRPGDIRCGVCYDGNPKEDYEKGEG